MRILEIYGDLERYSEEYKASRVDAIIALTNFILLSS
jgi:hypothetical protein